MSTETMETTPAVTAGSGTLLERATAAEAAEQTEYQARTAARIEREVRDAVQALRNQVRDVLGVELAHDQVTVTVDDSGHRTICQPRVVLEGLTFTARRAGDEYGWWNLYLERPCARCEEPIPLLLDRLAQLPTLLATIAAHGRGDCPDEIEAAQEAEPSALAPNAAPPAPDPVEQRVRDAAEALGQALKREQDLEEPAARS